MSTTPANDAPTPDPTPAPAAESARRAVFVVGSGRSGTSTMSGTLQTLGVHVPQPEVQADETNPKGFGEPRWVVDFHERLLRRANVQVSDARPAAWFETGKLATNEQIREELFGWLDQQFAEGGDEVVVKDPRLSWFLGLWRSAALRSAAVPSYITMLRPVTEVVGSKQKYYDQRFGAVSRTAAWVNVLLHTERGTRGAQRAFVRYHDLLSDWTVPLFELGEQFDLKSIKTATANDIRMVHNFIDPDLRRVQLTWDELDVPGRLRELAEETWSALDKLATPGGDTPEVQGTLDQLRTAYSDFYEEAEAIAQSTTQAAVREARGAKPGQAAPKPAGPAPLSPSASRVPHGVRAMIPPKARRAFRRAFGR
jgi:hypothetical protein